jgi:hypothetical protein
MGTFLVIAGLVLAFLVPGALLVLVPERTEKRDLTDRTQPDSKPVSWRERVHQRLEQRRLLGLLYLGLVAFAVMVIVALVLPAVLTQHPRLEEPAERYKAITDTRIGLVALLVAIGAFGGLAFTARTYRLSREGHITDRYSKAIEQLGDLKMEIRLGGIYALERLAIDSGRDHPTVVEVLSAFVRQHTIPSAGARVEPTTDVQAAVTVLGRLPHRQIVSRGDLTGANLTGAILTRANFVGANLFRIRLDDANLVDAELMEADLTGARLNRADLSGALLAAANLSGAELHEANLSEALLVGSDSSRCTARRRRPSSDPQMDAVGLTQEQLNSARGNARTRLPPRLQRPGNWEADRIPPGAASPGRQPQRPP